MNVGSKIGKLVTTARVAICGLAIFLCFVGTKFYDSANFFFLLGIFCDFRKVPVQAALIIF